MEKQMSCWITFKYQEQAWELYETFEMKLWLLTLNFVFFKDHFRLLYI